MSYYLLSTCNSTLPIVNFHEEGVKIQPIDHLLFAMVQCYIYIPSCDSVAHVFPRGLVVVCMIREWRVPGSIPAVAKDFFFHSYYCILISKDGCEKGRVAPRSWT